MERTRTTVFRRASRRTLGMQPALMPYPRLLVSYHSLSHNKVNMNDMLFQCILNFVTALRLMQGSILSGKLGASSSRAFVTVATSKGNDDSPRRGPRLLRRATTELVSAPIPSTAPPLRKHKACSDPQGSRWFVLAPAAAQN